MTVRTPADILPGYSVMSLPGGSQTLLTNVPSQPRYDPTNGLLSEGNLYWRTGK